MSTFYNFLDILKLSLSFSLGSNETSIKYELRLHKQRTDINNAYQRMNKTQEIKRLHMAKQLNKQIDLYLFQSHLLIE